ncbi:MAG: thiamine phosphate synthase [Verrucomicrobiales bacterium]
MHRPSDWLLYGILDLGYVSPQKASGMVDCMAAGGVDAIQLRAKNVPPGKLIPVARELRAQCRQAAIPLIINDHLHLALQVDADGLHWGQDDGRLQDARQELPPGTLLGRSTHSLAQARAAVEEGADYIGFGPLFATPTKPDYQPIGMSDIARCHQEVALPIFCIGGVKTSNLSQVLQAGARRVVVVSEILQSVNPTETCRQLKQQLSAADSC